MWQRAKGRNARVSAEEVLHGAGRRAEEAVSDPQQRDIIIIFLKLMHF